MENKAAPFSSFDLAPKGRDKVALAFTMEWLRHHDRYGDAAVLEAPNGKDSCCACEAAQTPSYRAADARGRGGTNESQRRFAVVLQGCASLSG